jgi:hypothetical protein
MMNVKGAGAAAAAVAVIMFGVAAGAEAADLNALPLKAAPSATGPASCTNIADFFTTACLVAGYGIRFYGTIDVGAGYQTNADPLSKYLTSGVNYNMTKANNGARFLFSPNAMSQSNVGLLVKEPLGSGWSFVAQLETPFDPYTLAIPSGSKTLRENLGVPLGSQTGSSDTWGTLTFLRQGDLFRDIKGSYDPIPGSYAFSLLANTGTYTGGGGSEQVRQTTSVKYRVNISNFRFGVFGQFGGYDEGNTARGMFQADAGTDFNLGPGLVSIDAAGGYARDAVSQALTGGTVNPLTGQAFLTTTPGTLQATISNNTSFSVDAKYTVGRLKVSGGYEWVQFAPPSDIPTSFTDLSGFLIGAGAPGTSIVGTTFNAKDKTLQLVYGGARYSITDSLDVAAAWYHVWQQDYSLGALTGGISCAQASTISSKCAGTQNQISGLIDWKFAPKWDVYFGVGYAALSGGLNSGYLASSNLNTTAGLRFRW